ncbi:NACHT, LRR and PYD domains-containing protein 3-like isoform X2 [Ambystoma mexicanum]|uniref:NACHT, LRR and PYD domains-containing protein 3-like isoform X2 n=1 Tax=Ambystoma mexicanum TaxID=8296 RepID=UPI0037E9585E
MASATLSPSSFLPREEPEAAEVRLHRILAELTGDQFKDFKRFLAECPMLDEESRRLLEKADCMDTVELMVDHFEDQSAFKITANLLERIHRKDLLYEFNFDCQRQSPFKSLVCQNSRAAIPQRWSLPKNAAGAANQNILGPEKALPTKFAEFEAHDIRRSRQSEASKIDQKEKYKEYIKAKFRLIKDRNHQMADEVTLKERYTKLLIIKDYRDKDEKKHDILSPGRGHLAVLAELQAEHSYSSIQTLFDPEKDGHIPSTVVLQGVSGIGKTMTCRKIMLDWASGELFQDMFDYMFYIHCRELNQYRGQRTIADLIPSCDGEPFLSMEEIEAESEKVLFIIDGFDELKIPENLLLNDPGNKAPMGQLIISLIKRNFLQKSSILITTRPTEILAQVLTACRGGERIAEILGFSEAKRKEYFTTFFGNKSQGKQAFNVVKEHEILFTMCFMPIVCWIVCKAVKQQMKKKEEFVYVSKTTTSVYMLVLSHLLTQQSSESEQNKVNINLRRLCALAKDGIHQQKILFEMDDLAEHQIDIPALQSLFLTNSIFVEEEEMCNVYSFIHLSFQEFFAALFYVLGEDGATAEYTQKPEGALMRLLKDYGEQRYDHLMMTVRFLFGLINKDILTQMERTFQWKVSSDIRPALEKWVKEEIERDGHEITNRRMDLLHCLLETQDEEFVKSATEHFPDKRLCIKSLQRALNTMDFRALSFFLQNSSTIKELEISDVRMKPEYLRALAPGLIKCSILRFLCRSLTGSCCADLASVLRTSTSLTELDLSRNKLTVSAVKALCEGLKHPGCKIHTLKLPCCSLTASCCADLASVLRTSTSLTELDLSRNKLGDSGGKALCEGLKQPGCKLQTLRLWCCSLSGLFCGHLTSALRLNSSLAHLYLTYNRLRDSGVKELCEGLKLPSCKIQTLGLLGCSLTAACCADLASVLRVNTTLRDLDLGANSLGDSGVKTLCEGLKHPGCNMQSLGLLDCSLTESCCADLASVLRMNTSLTRLVLRTNNLKDSGVKVLCEGLKPPACKIQTLGLSNTGLTDESTGTLLLTLSTKESLQHLVLYGNRFTGRSVVSFYTLKETIPYFKFEFPSVALLIDEEYIVDENVYRYRATFAEHGTFACQHTRLGFEVCSAGSLTYDLLPWSRQLEDHGMQDLKIAGPLFDIQAAPGFVKAVYLPHFVSLQGDVDTSRLQIAHFHPDGTMTLETASEVQHFHVFLKNPTFSKVGIVWKVMEPIWKLFPARACALLYRYRDGADVTLHLYLIPNEPLLTKELDKSAKSKVKIEKPAQTKPLYYGSNYSVECEPGSQITPRELEFDYVSPGLVLPFTEIYMKDLQAEGVTIGLKGDRNTRSVWEATVRPGDIAPRVQSSPLEPKTFIEKHRLALLDKIIVVEEIMAVLQQRRILSEYEVEDILKESTRYTKVSALLRMVLKKGAKAQQVFLDALRQKNRSLFKDLEQSD